MVFFLIIIFIAWLKTKVHVVVDCRARSSLTRPMRERQGEQCLQGNVMSGVVVEAARVFLLCLLSLSDFLLSNSNWGAAWWIEWRKATRSDHCLWSILQEVSDFFRLSLSRFIGAPLSRWPVESFLFNNNRLNTNTQLGKEPFHCSALKTKTGRFALYWYLIINIIEC